MHTHFQQTAGQNCARVFSNKESFIFYCNNSTSFESVLHEKQLKVDYSKNIWKEENRGHGFVCLLVGFIAVKKNHWKLQFCWCRSPTLNLILPIFGERKKYKSDILKKVGLSTFKEILEKYVYNSSVMFLTHYYFAWKGTLRP